MKTSHMTQSFSSHREAPLWKFGAIVAAALLAIKVVVTLGGAAGILGVFGYIALIGIAAYFWGADSREPGRNFYSRS